MIITKKIKINLNNKNKDHFKKLNYDILQKSIIVKVNDLMNGSCYRVDVSCDVCNNQNNITYRNYIRGFKNGGIYTCEKCSHIKSKQTRKRKYGDENYRNPEKNKKTCMERYGVEHVLQNNSFKEKLKQTKIERYGDEKYNNREKSKNTCLEKYGNEEYNNIEKYKKTCLERYGVYNYFSTDEFKLSQGIILDEDLKNEWSLYKRKSNRLFRKMKSKVFKNWNGYDYYDNEYIKENLRLKFSDGLYPTIDHKISVYYGFMNDISVEEINNTENLVITKRYLNSSKGIKKAGF